jgi:hypothetical protein
MWINRIFPVKCRFWNSKRLGTCAHKVTHSSLWIVWISALPGLNKACFLGIILGLFLAEIIPLFSRPNDAKIKPGKLI